ncbi:MAG TPA: type II toxin-antitoxin system RelE/ParE family toxin [Gammaproteobacteria bacterium]|nr:type II toxin-antitoxin system RelE/ParE family toxin [Gammaproteobacteria bacterium]
MANYSLAFKKSVAKDLRKIPNKDVKRILKSIELLRKDPRAEGCIKLSGQARYRVRQGVYRIIYEIRDLELIVLVVKVAHRSTAYKNS